MDRSGPRAHLYKLPAYKDLVGRLAANVQRLRAARKWTQDQAAEHACDMDTVQYRMVETQRANVTATTMARLCVAFKVDVVELLAPARAPKRRGRGRPSNP